MNANESQHSRIPNRTQSGGVDELHSGTGAASALERMKADRALRLKQQRGSPPAAPKPAQKHALPR